MGVGVRIAGSRLCTLCSLVSLHSSWSGSACVLPWRLRDEHRCCCSSQLDCTRLRTYMAHLPFIFFFFNGCRRCSWPCVFDVRRQCACAPSQLDLAYLRLWPEKFKLVSVKWRRTRRVRTHAISKSSPRFPSIFAQFARLRIFERSWGYRVRVQSENAGISLDVRSWRHRSPRLRWLGASGGFRMGVAPRFATVLFLFCLDVSVHVDSSLSSWGLWLIPELDVVVVCRVRASCVSSTCLGQSSPRSSLFPLSPFVVAGRLHATRVCVSSRAFRKSLRVLASPFRQNPAIRVPCT